MSLIRGVIVCLLVVILDITAGILGIEAEISQNKVKHLRFFVFECREPSHQAFRLGLAAAGLLILAHVIANLLGGCMCIFSKDELERASANRQLAVVCLLLSWIILGAGLFTLVLGAKANSRSNGSCGLSHHNFLAIGGICCFIHGLFCVGYYVSATATIAEQKPRQSGRA